MLDEYSAQTYTTNNILAKNQALASNNGARCETPKGS